MIINPTQIEHKFHAGQHVIIKTGFYADLHGVVVDNGFSFRNIINKGIRYGVQIRFHDYSKVHWFWPEDLEAA